MAIHIVHAQSDVDAIQGDKNVWYDIGRYVIYTGDDIDKTSSRLISVQAFRERFTKFETKAFLNKVLTDENVRELNFRLSTAQEPLDLDGLALKQGMIYLASIGVITEARRIEILA